MGCPHPARSTYPYDLVPGVVRVSEKGTTVIGTPSELDYEPVGETEMIWDSQFTVGYYCDDCGMVVLSDTIWVETTGKSWAYTRQAKQLEGLTIAQHGDVQVMITDDHVILHLMDGDAVINSDVLPLNRLRRV